VSARPAQLVLLEARQAPRTRGECEGGERPCRYTACRYHLWREDERAGRPHVWPAERAQPKVVQHSPETCALDVAERGEQTLEQVGSVLGLTAERVRQIEERALRRLGVDPAALRTALDAGVKDSGSFLSGSVRRGMR
jgi:hypothetical protein